MNDGINHPLKTDIVQFADDPRRGANRLNEDWSYSTNNDLVEHQIIRELQKEEDTEEVMINETYIDGELHNSEIMSKLSGVFHIKTPYQIPSIGFIDTAKILKESEYNSAENLEDNEGTLPVEKETVSSEEEFLDTQSEISKQDEGTLVVETDTILNKDELWDAKAEFSKMDEETSDLGLDQESDEDEFWDAQTDLECNDEGIEEEENNNIISRISLREHNKETEKEKVSRRVKYHENRLQRRGKLGHKMMFYILCSLILFGRMTLGSENSTYVKMNKIHKGNIK